MNLQPGDTLTVTTRSGNQPPRQVHDTVTVTHVAETNGRTVVWIEYADGRTRTYSPEWLARHARRPLDPTPSGPPVGGEQGELELLEVDG